MDVTVTWTGGMAFVGKGSSSHLVALDAAPEAGGSGQGVRPMEALLAALGGCTGMNVMSILRKMRIEVDAFEVRLSGRRQEDHPKAFTAIHLDYVFTGRGLEERRAQIERAVSLSHNRYCSVAATLGAGVTVTHRVVLQSPPSA